MTPEEAAFSYDLPRELIAQEPLSNRVDARLMLVERSAGRIDHFHIRDLPELLIGTDRMVLNNTSVIPARLVGTRTKTGGAWQGLFLGVDEQGQWRILHKTRGRIEPGEMVTLHDRNSRPAWRLALVRREEDGEWRAVPEQEGEALALLDGVGRVPLPPYIRGGNMVDSDSVRYQTVFAKHRGAVAAPTAGLHFTPELLREIERHGVNFTAVTLHVGLDTFRPIGVDDLDAHQMHTEWGELTATAAAEIRATRSSGGRIVAVGTTSVRVLESAARVSEGAVPDGWCGDTDLFIKPPYTFRAVDALLTNFHFPRTTLLVLVCAFAGRELMRRAYEEAIAEQYRFFSYGDAMLIV